MRSFVSTFPSIQEDTCSNKFWGRSARPPGILYHIPARQTCCLFVLPVNFPSSEVHGCRGQLRLDADDPVGMERLGLPLLQRAPERLGQVLSLEMLSPESAGLTTCTPTCTPNPYYQLLRKLGHAATRLSSETEYHLIDTLSFLSFNTPATPPSCQHTLGVSCLVFSHLYQYY